jgi:polyhydroxyalkanoate synthesis repressor PhaR
VKLARRRAFCHDRPVQRTTKRPRRGRPPGRERLDPGVTLVKKYGNRRLYDTRRSSYITLEELGELIAAGEDVQVVDAKTGEDLTKRVVTKIIFLEEERRNLDLLPLSFLRKLIMHRDDSIREFYQRYLALSLEVYRSSQQQVQDLFPFVPQAGASSPELEELKARISSLEARVSDKGGS